MKTVLLSLLCVCVWSQHTEGLTDQQATLGQSVTLACEFRLKAVVWFVIKPSSARPVMLLRTFGSEEAEYYDESLRSKYSEGSRSHLIINDVSVDDLGTYYCIQPGWALKISDGIRLDTEDLARTKLDTTGPSKPEQKNPPQDQRSNQIVIVTITLLMVVLFAAVIGLLMMNCKPSKKIPKYVNGHQFLDRRITSIQTNSTAGHNRHNSLTDHVYLDILPYSATYEIATY